MRNDLISQMLQVEFFLFQQVQNRGGRASCQDDFRTFQIMRGSQFSAWPTDLCESYWRDLDGALPAGRNLLTEKYARMMETTFPAEYHAIKAFLPPFSPEQLVRIDQISAVQYRMAAAVYAAYPLTCSASRPLLPDPKRPHVTSSMTYLRGELSTYSLRTLTLYWEYLSQLEANGGNLVKEILENTVRQYGYVDLDARERALRR